MSATINISYEYVPRFKSGDPEGVNYLEEHGYVVIANALTAEQSTEAYGTTWRVWTLALIETVATLGTTIVGLRRYTEAFCPVMA